MAVPQENNLHLETVAKDTLAMFDQITAKVTSQRQQGDVDAGDALATMQTFTGGNSLDTLSRAQQESQNSLHDCGAWSCFFAIKGEASPYTRTHQQAGSNNEKTSPKPQISR